VPGFLGVLVPKGTTSTNPRRQAAQQRQQEEQQGGGIYASPGGGQGPGEPGCVSDDMNPAPLPPGIAPASKGALVDGTLCGTPAASAGLASGDVITAVNGHAVTSPGALTGIISRYRPGTRVTIRWISVSGRTYARSLTLAAAPAQ
jgi:hypothetical protein